MLRFTLLYQLRYTLIGKDDTIFQIIAHKSEKCGDG